MMGFMQVLILYGYADSEKLPILHRNLQCSVVAKMRIPCSRKKLLKEIPN
jgi:hypothetical protein